MSDTLNRAKLQLRPVSVNNGSGEKSPQSPSAKLLLNHGKPNYTIQRSPKAQQNDGGNPLSPEVQNNNRNNYNPYKLAGVKTNGNSSATSSLSRASSISSNYNGNLGNGNTNGHTNGNAIDNGNGNANGTADNNNDIVVQSTKFNGAFKPANVSLAATAEPEGDWVVLRRAQKSEPAVAPQSGDENVPEFIRRQRRIQERLAKENILDFENRRSGYFTHVVISPSSPNRTSFVDTMTSPAIVPSLEIPPPTKENKEATIVEEEKQEDYRQQQQQVREPEHESESHLLPATNGSSTNGNVEEEEVAKAIEEVNKAVAGELVDDDKTSDLETTEQVNESHVEETQPTAVAVVTSALIDDEVPHAATQQSEALVHAEVAVVTLDHAEEQQPTEQHKENGHEAVVTTHKEEAQTNGYVANGSSDGDATDDVTISHTNGVNGSSETPSLPIPDPSGALGVNYESKTVVSFSKDLGSEPNKYPDTVKVVKEGEPTVTTDEWKDLAKLKFDIKTDEEDVQVTPVLRTN